MWRSETARLPYGLDVYYVESGSALGRDQYIEGAFDFAVSDTPFSARHNIDLRACCMSSARCVHCGSGARQPLTGR